VEQASPGLDSQLMGKKGRKKKGIVSSNVLEEFVSYFVFVEFFEHTLDEEEFNLCSMTVLGTDLNSTPIY